MEIPTIETHQDLVQFLTGIQAKAAGHDVQTEVTNVAGDVERLLVEARRANQRAQVTRELLDRLSATCSVL